MEGIETNIVLSATGGATAAGEIGSATAAIDGLAAASGRMQERFQARFEHVGLHLLTFDLLRTIGLGGEARQVMMILQLAMSSLGTGGIMLLVTAFAALAAAVVKVLGHQKDLLDQTQQAIEADDKRIKSIQDQTSEIEAYGDATGHLNKVQEHYLELLRAENEEQERKKNLDLMARISALNDAIAHEDTYWDRLKRADVMQTLIKGTIVESTAAVEEHNAKLREMNIELAKAQVDMNMLHTHGTKAMKDVTQETKKAADEYEKDFETAVNEVAEDLQKQAKVVQIISGQIGTDLGNAFAKSLVEGKKFTDEMKAAFTRMAEQMIADMVRMGVEAAALAAMGLPMGGALAGTGSLIGKFFGGSFAGGGDVMVDRPTLFLAGEAGPERATFTPMASTAADMGMSGDGSGVSIGSISMQISVSGVNDPNAIAQQVGQKIIEQIRGAGQIAFTRS